MSRRTTCTFILIFALAQAALAADAPKLKAPTMADVLATSQPGDWRALDPENTLYLELAAGRVIIELYAVIGHAPRQLDRNVTLLGRVVQGIELLAALPRGTAALGFYEKPEQRVPIKSARVAADLPITERTALEVMRTEAPIFRKLIESRRNRREEWFHFQAGRIEVCNVPIPVRKPPAAAPP